MKNKHIINNITAVLRSHGYQGTIIHEIKVSCSLIHLSITIPAKYTTDDFQQLLPNIQQSINTVDHRIIKSQGKRVLVEFARNELQEVVYSKSFDNPDSLKVSFSSIFDKVSIDFLDGASCHMLIGGAPRMGKTFSIIYLSTMVYTQNKGNIELYIVSQKGRDFYPFENKKNIEIIKEESDFDTLLQYLIDEYKQRDQLLYTLPKATDSKSVKKLHPHHYKHFQPIFIIVDEYADYIGMKPIQDKVFELVRKAGYLNVHVILCTQRPEARFTLPANIKMGLMVRLCLPVTDKNNSVVVLDEEGAENLPRKEGRALLKDGNLHTIQIPLMNYDTCEKLLQPYERNVSRETNNIKENTGSINHELSNKIQSMFQESIVQPDISSQLQSNKRLQPNDETINNGWFLLTDPTVKR